MSTSRKINQKGRNTTAGPFVMLPYWLLNCPAYRALKPGPRALLIEFALRYNGSNNGRIAFSARDMSEAIQVRDRQTVASYVRVLEAFGFIKASKRGGFSVKVADRRASEWELTWRPAGDNPASKEFMRWRPNENDGAEKPSCKEGNSVPRHEQTVRGCSNVWDFPSHAALKVAVGGTG